MRFGIVGAGAIGCLFGARLAQAGHDVTLIHRDPSIVRAIQRNGVALKDTDGKFKRVRVPALKGPAKLPGTDVLIVAVKAYDTRAMAASYRNIVAPQTTILSLQNGLGNIETLHATLRNYLLGGSTTEGALSLRPGSVIHTGRGSTVIGHPGGPNRDICSRVETAFIEAGFQTKTSSNIQGVLWTKAIINAAINPISSLTKLPNGALAKSPHIQEIARRTINEGISVSHAVPIKLVGDPRKLWRKIVLSTSVNKSSMLQDIERAKRTEIRQLNGALVSYGEKARVKTPINYILTKLVLGLEESSKMAMKS